jgi:hypothetical protein
MSPRTLQTVLLEAYDLVSQRMGPIVPNHEAVLFFRISHNIIGLEGQFKWYEFECRHVQKMLTQYVQDIAIFDLL